MKGNKVSDANSIQKFKVGMVVKKVYVIRTY